MKRVASIILLTVAGWSLAVAVGYGVGLLEADNATTAVWVFTAAFFAGALGLRELP